MNPNTNTNTNTTVFVKKDKPSPSETEGVTSSQSSKLDETHQMEMELLNAFQKLEMPNDDDAETEHHQQAEDLEDRLSSALRVLNHLEGHSHSNSDFALDPLPLVEALHSVGFIHCELKRFRDGLGFLNRANTILSELRDQGIAVGAKLFHEVQFELFKAHFGLSNYKDALSFSLEVMEVHEMWWGPNSAVLAQDRKLLALLYGKLGENEKALEQTVLAQGILKNWDLRSDSLLRGEIDKADAMIALGRYDEAVETLENVAEKADEGGEIRAHAYISMAKGFCDQKKFANCKRCLRISLEILEKREPMFPGEVAQDYHQVSKHYESMKDFDTAISLMMRSLALLEKLPQEPDSLGRAYARIGMLLMLTRKDQEAVPYLQRAAEIYKYSLDPNDIKVFGMYNNLGQAYLRLDKPESAVEMFAIAKDIIDVSHGPHDPIAIGSCQNLSKAYADMKSFGPAIELQQQVVNAWESLGASAEVQLREAKRGFQILKMQARHFYASESRKKKTSC